MLLRKMFKIKGPRLAKNAFEYVVAMKIRSGKLTFNIQNSKKNLLISVLSTEYKREVLSIDLHFKQAVAVRDLQHHQHHHFQICFIYQY